MARGVKYPRPRSDTPAATSSGQVPHHLWVIAYMVFARLSRWLLKGNGDAPQPISTGLVGDEFHSPIACRLVLRKVVPLQTFNANNLLPSLLGEIGRRRFLDVRQR